MGYEVREYRSPTGRCIFSEWLDSLKDHNRMAAAKIERRLERIRDDGFLGDHRSVGDHVYELRIHGGPGYRVYYLWEQTQIIVLLCGGDKGSQARDIVRAKLYAADFWRRR